MSVKIFCHFDLSSLFNIRVVLITLYRSIHNHFKLPLHHKNVYSQSQPDRTSLSCKYIKNLRFVVQITIIMTLVNRYDLSVLRKEIKLFCECERKGKHKLCLSINFIVKTDRSASKFLSILFSLQYRAISCPPKMQIYDNDTFRTYEHKFIKPTKNIVPEECLHVMLSQKLFFCLTPTYI